MYVSVLARKGSDPLGHYTVYNVNRHDMLSDCKPNTKVCKIIIYKILKKSLPLYQTLFIPLND